MRSCLTNNAIDYKNQTKNNFFITGKAQEVYFALNAADSFELVPEAYQQNGRRKMAKHMLSLAKTYQITLAVGWAHLKFPPLMTCVSWWFWSSFKKMLPVQISTFITEKKEPDVTKAAASTDEFTLLHKSSFPLFLSQPQNQVVTQYKLIQTSSTSSMTSTLHSTWKWKLLVVFPIWLSVKSVLMFKSSGEIKVTFLPIFL